MRNIKIKRIVYNWFTTSVGDEFKFRQVGAHDVMKIEKARTPGTKDVYFRVHYKNGAFSDIYNVNQVDWSSED